MTDSSARPKRPQFGEYATPEEQRASIREPLDEQRAAELGVSPVVPLGTSSGDEAKPGDASASASGHLAAGSAPVHPGPSQSAGSGHFAGSRPTPPATPPVAPTRYGPNGEVLPPRRSADRIATFVLIAIGLLNIVVTMPNLLDLAGAVRTVYVQFDISGYNSDQLAQILGITALLAQVILWVAALMLSSRALRAGKPAFWIPLVAGVVANVILIAAVSIAIASDPAFLAFVQANSTK